MEPVPYRNLSSCENLIDALLRARENAEEHSIMRQLDSRQAISASRTLIKRLLQADSIDEELWQLLLDIMERKAELEGGPAPFHVAWSPRMQQSPAHSHMQQQNLVHAANQEVLTMIRRATTTDDRKKILHELRKKFIL
jgi:hypothetical protein